MKNTKKATAGRSGGKREVEKKHRERQAKRRRNGYKETDWRERYEALGPAPVGHPEKAHQWIADVTLLAIEEASRDPGLPPEQRREQVARLAAQAAKVLDPAKLAARLAEIEEAFTRLMEQRDAARIQGGAPLPA